MKSFGWKVFAELVALMTVVGGLIAVVIELRQSQSALSTQAYAPHWRVFRIPEPRQQFSEKVERVVADQAVNLSLEKDYLCSPEQWSIG
ncbi:MAG: hypothetical protein OEQ16_14150 [Gammaproteobacteria bacterium]|jgi:hypothetical protein|nr:hypothetical protein [Gammaproteobacteria bacterium]